MDGIIDAIESNCSLFAREVVAVGRVGGKPRRVRNLELADQRAANGGELQVGVCAEGLE